MALEIYLDHGKDDVNQAIVQFAARRSYRLRQPWYLDGTRIEASPHNHSAPSNLLPPRSAMNKPVEAGNLFSIFGNDVPRIDVNLKRKRGRTRLRITIGQGPASTQLAYELQNYLQDDRAYDCQCPAMCPKCGSRVPNVQARYCGRCGQQLVASDADDQPRPAVKVEHRHKSSLQHAVVPPLPPLPAPSSVEIRTEQETPAAQAISPVESETLSQNGGTDVSPVVHHRPEARATEDCGIDSRATPTESPRDEEKNDESATISDVDKRSDGEALPSAKVNPPATREVKSISDRVRESEEEPADSTDACSPVEKPAQRRAIAED